MQCPKCKIKKGHGLALEFEEKSSVKCCACGFVAGLENFETSKPATSSRSACSGGLTSKVVFVLQGNHQYRGWVDTVEPVFDTELGGKECLKGYCEVLKESPLEMLYKDFRLIKRTTTDVWV